MNTEDFISTAPLVAITNLELIEITWLCHMSQEYEQGSLEKQKAFQEVKDKLSSSGALIFHSTPVNDLEGVGSYKVLSSMHGWFKGTPYEKQAFFQICLDESDKDAPQYALVSISDYDASEHTRISLEKLENHSDIKGRSH